MDLPWGDSRTTKFITNVGLITTDGPMGPNIMSAEWTHHISYSPGLIAICINKTNKVSANNIKETKEFGVNICSTEQSKMATVAGVNSGKDINKIEALKELGFEFYTSKNIKTLMVKDAVVNIECKIVNTIDSGSHTMFIGEVLSANLTEGKQPLALHDGKYWKLSETIENPSDDERESMKQIVEKHTKN
jgi:flavin reductase (DIM6/NTAB) family NADH-FMN oxidoreductase RutF